MKKAIIFGVTGQDGAYLAKFLLKKGYLVYGTSRDADFSNFSNLVKLGIKNDVQLLSANLIDFRSVLAALKVSKADEIYNLAGQSSVGLSFNQPVDTFNSIAIANLNLLEAIRFIETEARYYNAGSSECFGNTTIPATEETSFHPRSPYATAKAAAFFQTVNYRESYKLYACSGILFNHESPLRPERFVTQKIVRTACRIAKGHSEKLVLGNINISRDWGWAPEYIEAMYLILQQPVPKDFIIATGFTCTLQDFIQYVFETLGLNWQDHIKINSDFFRPSDIEKICANPDKALHTLKWQAKYKAADVAKMLVEAEMLASS